jgi:hypothetical protein
MPVPQRKGTDRGDFFELPLDTTLKLIEANPAARRAALIAGATLLNTGEKYQTGSAHALAGSADAQAFRANTGYKRTDVTKTDKWESSFRKAYANHNLALIPHLQEYQLHPEITKETALLRVFVYEPTQQTLLHHVPSTLIINRVDKNDPRYASLESKLEVEVELGNNAQLLREAAQKLSLGEQKKVMPYYLNLYK